MSPDRDDRAPEDEEYEEEYVDDEPRSVFSTSWFRAIIVVVVLAVVGILALPYLLDWVSPLRSGPTVSGPTLTSPSPPRETVTAPPSPVPASPPAGGGPPAPPGTQAAQAPSSVAEPAKPPSPTAPSPATTPAAPAAKAAVPSKTDLGKSPTPAGQAPRAVESKPAESSGKTGNAMEAAKPAVGSPAAKAPATRAAVSRETAARGGGLFWVQVGAFRDEARAKALAAQLRADNFKVEEVSPSTAGRGTPVPSGTEGPGPVSPADRYDVFVSGASSADVNAKLAGKGLAADSVAGGAVIKPSLPLRDAVALSKDLATEGLKVQVRRATGSAAAERPAPSGAAGDGLYRVRVGGFADRAAAEEARKALAAKGHTGFIARSGG